MPDLIGYETRGRTAVIRFQRADKRNAFTVDMFRELSAAFGRAEDDSDVRAVLLYGDGQDMTTGLDLMDVAPAWMAGERPFNETDVDPWGVC